MQAEDGIREVGLARGLGDVYKRVDLVELGATYEVRLSLVGSERCIRDRCRQSYRGSGGSGSPGGLQPVDCPLDTSDAADDLICVDLGGSRITKHITYTHLILPTTYSVYISVFPRISIITYHQLTCRYL